MTLRKKIREVGGSNPSQQGSSHNNAATQVLRGSIYSLFLKYSFMIIFLILYSYPNLTFTTVG